MKRILSILLVLAMVFALSAASADGVKEALEAGSELEVWQISPETEEVINVMTDLALGEDSVSFSARSTSFFASPVLKKSSSRMIIPAISISSLFSLV